MTELREKIARAMHDYGTERGIGENEALDIADNILAIPRIRKALEYYDAMGGTLPDNQS